MYKTDGFKFLMESISSICRHSSAIYVRFSSFSESIQKYRHSSVVYGRFSYFMDGIAYKSRHCSAVYGRFSSMMEGIENNKKHGTIYFIIAYYMRTVR